MRVKTPFQVVMYIYLELKTKMMFPIVNQVMLKTIQTALITCKVNFEKKGKSQKYSGENQIRKIIITWQSIFLCHKG